MAAAGGARILRAVLFDFFDTLAAIDVPTIEAGRQRVAELAGLTFDDLAPLWRQTSEARRIGALGGLTEELRAMLRMLHLRRSGHTIERMAAAELEAWRRGVRLYPDAAPTLRALRAQGLRLGILSNCSIQAGEAIRASGLPELLDATVLSFEVGLAKPDPAIYRQACAKLGTIPSHTAFVGDGDGGELEAANALGLRTIKIYRLDRRVPEDLSIRADHRVESLAEVPALIA